MDIINKIKELPWHSTRKWSKRSLSRINKIVVHQELANGTTESVNRYHITPGPQNHLSKRGAPHFAYHFGIEKDGTVIQANNLSDITWHTKNHNTKGIGIMLVGDFSGPDHAGGEPTDRQILAIEDLIDHILKKIKHLNKYGLYGHSDFNKPACPGYAIMDFIEDYKT